MSYQERDITDSNIADLINDQMRSRKTLNPRRYLPFTETLEEMNVPSDLIGNPRRLNLNTGSTVGGGGGGTEADCFIRTEKRWISRLV